MKFSGATLGLLVWIVAGHPTCTLAGFTTVNPTPATLADGPATVIGAGGSGISPLATSPIYSDVTNYTGFSYANGGAGTTSFGNTTTTNFDDITTAAGSGGGAVTSFTFSVANLNAAAVAASPVILIYGADGAGGAPGTLLASFLFNPITFGTGVGTFTYSSSATLFTVPTSRSFFVGEAFIASGATTTAQLNNLGEGIFNPPTVGSSQDVFYQTSSSSLGANNPAGSFLFFGGNPVANFGFAFSTTTAAVPEPSSLVLVGLAGAMAAGFSRTRRAVMSRRLAS